MKIRACTKTYNGRTVLTLPELELKRDTSYAIVGTNGSGKSTLAKLLCGVEAPDEGGRLLDGVSVGYMPQNSFAFRMSVLDNLLLNGGDKERALMLSERMGISALLDKRAKSLSGGETERMALCRILMRDYELLILDEPTAAMDIEATAKSEALTEEYRKRLGCTLLVVTHSLQQAKRMADEVIFLHEGSLNSLCGTHELNAPRTPELKRFVEFFGV